MTVKLYFHGYISPLPNLVNVADVSGKTVVQCVDEFVKLYPSIKKSLFDEKGKFSEHFVVFIDGNKVSVDENKPVEDGQELHIVSLVDGG